MKKLLISIVILLIILLLGQLTYFNFSKKKPENTTNIVNTTVNNETEEEEMRNGVEEDVVIKNVVEPVNIAELSQIYQGNTKLIELEKTLYTFVNENIKKIYNMTTGKSVNQILQLYDLNEQEIKNMNICSREDFNGVSSECIKISRIKEANYASSTVDLESFNGNENGYSTFKLKIIYTNSSEIEIKVYLANDNSMIPNIKFGK